MAVTGRKGVTLGALPATTRVAEYRSGGDIVVREVALPAPREGEISVRIEACGICASETLRWYMDAKAPIVLGHEPVGRVVAVGEHAAFALGERVFIHHHAPCQECARCRRGDYVQCDSWRASRLSPGGLSQYATVPALNVQYDVLRLPDELRDERGTLIEPLATVVKSVRRSGLRPGDRVLVVGLGAMGLLHALVVRHAGAALLFGADRSGFRLEAAARFGVDHAIDIDAGGSLAEQLLQRTSGEGAEIVFVTPGSRAALESALPCVARGGTLVVFTPIPPDQRWPLDVADAFFKDVNIVTSYSAGPDDTRAALALLAGGLAVDGLFTHRFDLEHAAQAYAALKDTESALKIVVYPNA
ncbi:MAG: alcohol dehydrogenase catalytic domain-containing protein [Candidatus Eremiobacteraeota bacterium]|nr:alcohol dehydrogenase catalytic domain-containing protein [Candidatus Eremiobacteraeota bacterium]